jgi:hypothetical protein
VVGTIGKSSRKFRTRTDLHGKPFPVSKHGFFEKGRRPMIAKSPTPCASRELSGLRDLG